MRYVLLFFALHKVISTEAQVLLNEAENLQRYWNYRQRFIGDDDLDNIAPYSNRYAGFIQIGDNGPGFSIPAENKNKFAKDDEDWYKPNAGGCDGGDYNQGKEGIVFWGDANTWIGRYLAVLATEWKLLTMNGQSTAMTEQEIYYALKATTRLDNYEETVFAYYPFPTKNGNIARDDVPPRFVRNDVAPNEHEYFGSDYSLTQSDARADYLSGTNCYPNYLANCDWLGPMLEPFLNTPSNDQYTYMIYGLRFITDMLPFGVNVQGDDLRFEALKIANRIVNYTKNVDPPNIYDYLFPSVPILTKDDTWVLLDANGEKVCRGWAIKHISYPIAVSCGLMNGFGSSISTTLTNPYQNKFSYYKGKPIWNELKIKLPDIISNVLQGITNPTVVCAAFSIPGPFGTTVTVGWPQNCEEIPTLGEFEINRIFILATISETWDPFLAYHAYNHGKGIFDLAAAVLDGTQPFYARSYWQGILNSAPCDGPCHYNTNELGCDETPGWQSNDRFANSLKMVDINPGHREGGDYNGLDYMLAYNLYRLVYSTAADVPAYINLIDRNLSNNYPFQVQGNTVGDDLHPLTHKAASTIRISGTTVQATGNVTFVAGKEITMDNEFEAVAESEFEAYIEPLDCEVNYYDFGTLQAAIFKTANGNGTQSDEEGELIYSPKETKPAAGLKSPATIVPNPSATGIFTISGITNIGKIEVSNVLGETVHSSNTLTPDYSFDISTQPKGIYFVKVRTEEKMFVQKVIYQ